MRFSELEGSIIPPARKFTEMELAIMEGGGSLDKPTLSPRAIAAQHNVSYDYILTQLAAGIRVELEHTSYADVAKEIALDHLAERPDYYERLKVAEHKKGVKAIKYNKKPKTVIEPRAPIKPKKSGST